MARNTPLQPHETLPSKEKFLYVMGIAYDHYQYIQNRFRAQERVDSEATSMVRSLIRLHDQIIKFHRESLPISIAEAQTRESQVEKYRVHGSRLREILLKGARGSISQKEYSNQVREIVKSVFPDYELLSGGGLTSKVVSREKKRAAKIADLPSNPVELMSVASKRNELEARSVYDVVDTILSIFFDLPIKIIKNSLNQSSETETCRQASDGDETNGDESLP